MSFVLVLDNQDWASDVVHQIFADAPIEQFFDAGEVSTSKHEHVQVWVRFLEILSNDGARFTFAFHLYKLVVYFSRIAFEKVLFASFHLLLRSLNDFNVVRPVEVIQVGKTLYWIQCDDVDEKQSIGVRGEVRTEFDGLIHCIPGFCGIVQRHHNFVLFRHNLVGREALASAWTLRDQSESQ